MLHLRTDWQSIQDTHPIREKLLVLRDAVANNAENPDRIVSDIEAILSMMPVAQGSSIAEDEPIFLLRSKSRASSWESVIRYAQIAFVEGATPEYVRRVIRWAHEMRIYGATHYPDSHPPGAPELLPG